MTSATNSTETTPAGPAKGKASATSSAGALRVRRRRSLWKRIYRERGAYVFILPGLCFILLFAYVPMLGNIVAFQDYSPYLGIAGSEFVGFENFKAIFRDPEVMNALVNTLIISALQIVFAFPAPILLALFLNSLLSDRTKRTIQTIVYLPHFISWVVVISIWQKILGGAGLVSQVFERIGLESVNIMANPETFKILVTAQVIWKDVGWGTIIFFAAIASIPTELYEAAAADGAGSWRRMWHITLPGMLPVISILLILTVGNTLSVGFEQLLLQQPAVGAAAAQVLDTFVYFRGIAGGDWGISTAAGLLKGVIATILVLGANWLAKRMGGEGVI